MIRSWVALGALGSLLGDLGGPREPWPESVAGHGREVLTPPGRNTHFGTPPPRALPTRKRGRDHREEGKVPQEELRTTIGKREESTRRTKDHNREEKECRMEERDPTHAQMAQGAGGFVF